MKTTDANKLSPFSWPTPPYASYPGSSPRTGDEACEVEGANGAKSSGLLVALDMIERLAFIRVSPSGAPLPVHFEQFRSITLATPLKPRDSTVADEYAKILQYRPAVDYQMDLADGRVAQGLSVGHVETDDGLFLFPPADGLGSVQRKFLPRSSFKSVRFGARIGKLLVEQNALTKQQLDEVARLQADVRDRKLGDYLVSSHIVSPEQLMQALDQQAKMPMIKIGEALTALGLVTQDQLSHALENQKEDRTVPLGELLIRAGRITREDLHIALARKMGYPVVDIKRFPIDVLALQKVPFKIAQRLNVLPLLLRDHRLVVAMEDPSQRSLVDEMEFAVGGQVIPVLAGASGISEQLYLAYQKIGAGSLGANHRRSSLDAEIGYSGGFDFVVDDPSMLLESLQQQSG